jgi:hypothetical protein
LKVELFSNVTIQMIKYSKMKKKVLILFALLVALTAKSQIEELEVNQIKDSLYIHEVENKFKTDKVLHAEPLYIDLIRDLGARKGEKEWNLGFGMTDNNDYTKYTALIEYEWAPIDRLGFEVELPFSLYYPINGNLNPPGNRLNSLKLATQYSFYVSEKNRTSMALGYIHEFELNDINKYRSGNIYIGNVYNPFFVAAKRWGTNFHTLVYTGPAISQHFSSNTFNTRWEINSNFHYMIPGTRNFIGIEFNKTRSQGDFDMTVRPQMRVGIAENLLVGIVTGIPISREFERFSTFIRLIYEPKHK